jgi:hypothetical protein
LLEVKKPDIHGIFVITPRSFARRCCCNRGSDGVNCSLKELGEARSAPRFQGTVRMISLDFGY